MIKNKRFLKSKKFKILSKQKNLIHGVFNKSFGNVSLEYARKEEVIANKKKIAKALAINWQNIYSVKQVHGTKIKILKSKKLKPAEEEADGLITNIKNVFLMIKTADCFPVLFFDPIKKVVAAVHVGWRGAIEKIFLTALLKMINTFSSQAKDILVGIGPGIGPCCFKHKTLIQEKLPEWQEYIQNEKNNWKSLNLSGFIKDQLVEAGIKRENIESVKICTCCSKDYFSHLRSLQTGEPEGRFATIIGIR